MSKLYSIRKTARQLRIARDDDTINKYALKFGKIIIVPSKADSDRLGLLDNALSGTSLFHSGWSGQTVFMDFMKNFYAIVLTTRYGDGDAKYFRSVTMGESFESVSMGGRRMSADA